MTETDKASALRAMRAWLGIEQAEAALGAGLSGRTLRDAEKGRDISEKTWSAIMSYYASRGLHWRDADAGAPASIVFMTSSDIFAT